MSSTENDNSVLPESPEPQLEVSKVFAPSSVDTQFVLQRDMDVIDFANSFGSEQMARRFFKQMENVLTVKFLRLGAFCSYTNIKIDEEEENLKVAVANLDWSSVQVLDVCSTYSYMLPDPSLLTSLKVLVAQSWVPPPNSVLPATLKKWYFGVPPGNYETSYTGVLNALTANSTCIIYFYTKKFPRNEAPPSFAKTRDLVDAPAGESRTLFDNALVEWQQENLDAGRGGICLQQCTSFTGEVLDAEVTDTSVANLRSQFYCNIAPSVEQVKIAVLDTGVDFNHPDLRPYIRGLKSCVRGENAGQDTHGHGTHCAGIIAGAKTGIATGAQLYIAQVFNKRGGSAAEWVADGLRWAIDQEVDVISMSFRLHCFDQQVFDLIAEATSNHIIVCAAAGNTGSVSRQNVNFPASVSSVIRVGSVGVQGAASTFSSVGGAAIDAVAPGEKIISCKPGGTYCIKTGSSMATPIIAAVCARLLAFERQQSQQSQQPRAQSLHNESRMKQLLRAIGANPTADRAKGGGIDRKSVV